MIDMATYKVMHDDEEPSAPRDEPPAEDMLTETLPAEPFALLLPATIRGYGFHNKKWSK
jgi:hypothetical protein